METSVRSRGVHQFNVTITSWPLTKQEHRRVFGQLHGFTAGTQFELVLPGYTDEPEGAAVGNPVVRTSAIAGQTFLQLKNGGLNQVVQHAAGDYFQLAGQSKVYIITKDSNTNGQGQTTINFWPPLRQNVAVDQPLIVRNVAMKLILIRDVLSLPIRSSSGKILRLELDCEEDLRT